MDFKKRIIEELEMTDIQADTLYKGYVQVAEKLAKEYHTEQLRIAVVVQQSEQLLCKHCGSKKVLHSEASQLCPSMLKHFEVK